MRHAVVVFAAVLATSAATSSGAQDLAPYLPPDQIAPFGKDAYQVREPPPIDVADRSAKEKATQYCGKMNKAMVIKSGTFSLGYGLHLIFSCVPPRQDAVGR
jgi:hypothetical protein